MKTPSKKYTAICQKLKNAEERSYLRAALAEDIASIREVLAEKLTTINNRNGSTSHIIKPAIKLENLNKYPHLQALLTNAPKGTNPRDWPISEQSLLTMVTGENREGTSGYSWANLQMLIKSNTTNEGEDIYSNQSIFAQTYGANGLEEEISHEYRIADENGKPTETGVRAFANEKTEVYFDITMALEEFRKLIATLNQER